MSLDMTMRGLLYAKPEPRKRTKGRKLRVESLVKQRVRAECVERDGDCRIATGREDRRNWTTGHPCSGESEWMHIGAKKRARTRGQAPAIRHTTAASCMGCTRHHRDYDAGRSDETMSGPLKAPFPWFGGKSRASDLVWSRFGNVPNYVEPFAGSLAVLLARPHVANVETVNDKDCYLANFWRALQHDAEAVAQWADAPVNEADLHARHQWLVNQGDFIERMKVEPEHFDVRIAGWWVWGQCLWIGSGWCDSANVPTKLPNLTAGHGDGTGVASVRRQIPDLAGDSGAAGRGVHSKTIGHRLPHVSDNGTGIHASGIHASGIHAYLSLLSQRLRRVRVVCGDWRRVCTPAVTSGIGLTGVLLDPPYKTGADLYNHGGLEIGETVREWAIYRGDDPTMRIALCGYEGDHDMPPSWECVGWTAKGGYGSQRKDGTNENRKRERIWFSPACLKVGLFS